MQCYLKHILPINSRILQNETFSGSSLIVHACQQYCIISGRTANTEKEEAMFTTIKNNTNLTSNHHPDNIISNVIIRYQAKKKLEVNKINKEDSVITNYKTTVLSPSPGLKITVMNIRLTLKVYQTIYLMKNLGGKKLTLV